MPRTSLLRRARPFALALTALASAATTVVVPAARADAAYGATILVQGHGFGHGRGLGQWGSLGYAVTFGWSHTQILDRYYGGTTAGTIDPNAVMTVRLVQLDDQDTIVVSDNSTLTTPLLPGQLFGALRVQANKDGSSLLFSGPPGCAGPWTPVPVALAPGQPVAFATDPGQLDSADPSVLPSVCAPDGSRRYYRGTIAAVRDLNGAPRTVNTVTMERYLRGVIPREMPANWADMGGGKGAEALDAQTVAARSYAWAEARYSYAKTCDTTACQVYGGAGLLAPGGALTTLEDNRTNAAVAATAGQVRLMPDGTVARAEFSASTGGQTAGGVFPSVADAGDAIPLNPNRSWTATIPTALVEKTYPQIGHLITIDVASRNGIGDFGGRAQKVVLRGTAGTVTLSGNDFKGAMGLKSDWFRIASSFLDVPAVAVAPGPNSAYWIAAADGGVYGFNGAPYAGGMTGKKLKAPIVGLTPTPDGQGYWLLGRDGGVFSFNAPFFGSTGNKKLNKPVVGLTVRPQADGYWFVASDGGIFAFGAAPFLGSAGGQKLSAPVITMVATPSGGGYYLVQRDGKVLPFGDAAVFAAAGTLPMPNQPIVGMALRPQGDGYWLVSADGAVFPFGAARDLGSVTGQKLGGPIIGMASSPSGNGYRLVGRDGVSYPFGDAV